MANKFHYAARFGLPESQIKFFTELTTAQKSQVAYKFGLVGSDQYVYAVKRDGMLVSNREKRNLLAER